MDNQSTSKRQGDSHSFHVFKRPKPSNGSDPNSTFVELDESTNRRRGMNFKSMDAYTRHKMLVNYYVLTHPGKVSDTFTRDSSRDKSELSVLLENHRFIWSDEELNTGQLTWGQRVARKYYEQLFKEYCIVDLSRYKENKFGMRWRSEPEVLEGKGQFICGAKRCQVKGGLTSWEVLFAYMERGEKKSALVKVRLCPECSDMLNYSRMHKKAKLKERKAKKRENNFEEASTSSKSSSGQPGAITNIKEEIVTDVEDNNDTAPSINPDANYQDLIDQIWKQPVKLEPEETETTLEEEVDDYLNQLFM